MKWEMELKKVELGRASGESWSGGSTKSPKTPILSLYRERLLPCQFHLNRSLLSGRPSALAQAMCQIEPICPGRASLPCPHRGLPTPTGPCGSTPAWATMHHSQFYPVFLIVTQRCHKYLSRAFSARSFSMWWGYSVEWSLWITVG